MKVGTKSLSGSWLLRVSLMVVAVVTPHARATVHLVQFGGTLGESYSPAFFAAAVGDTVRWQGDFSAHPLSSTTIPSGADSWQDVVGTTFDYVVKVPGAYNYQCDFHAPVMVGSFTVVLTALSNEREPQALTSFRLDQNYPNPFNPTTTIKYTIAGVGSQGSAVTTVRLVVYDLLGREVAVAVNERQAPGNYEVRFSGAGLSSGVYIYRLTARQTDVGQAGSFVQSKRMLFAK